MTNQNLSQSNLFDFGSDDLHKQDLLCEDLEINNLSNIINALDFSLFDANLQHQAYLYDDNIQKLRHELESISRRLKLINIINLEVKN